LSGVRQRGGGGRRYGFRGRESTQQKMKPVTAPIRKKSIRLTKEKNEGQWGFIALLLDCF